MIVGDGPYEKKLRAVVTEQKLEKQVIFKGKIPFEKLLNSNIYTNAGIFITASTSETQGLSIVEGMSYGLPVVGVAKRGIAELIKGNGLPCKTANAKEIARNILTIINSPELAKKMSLESLHLAKKYAISTVTAEFEKAYENLIFR